MSSCVHCDELVFTPYYNESDVDKKSPFCCQGCLTVFNVLHEKGLDSYYKIKQNSSIYKRRSPVELRSSEFKYLDDADFLKEYSYSIANELTYMEFYLEGIHCLACLWLIEKLPEFLEGVHSAKLDLERSVVTVSVTSSGKFSLVARELDHLGYRPHPLKNNQEAINLKKKNERSALIRIGVAGAAAGNIMIYAVSLYGGAESDYGTLFNNLTVAFGIPVLTYSAFPFYQTAWMALKNKTLSIDIPISMALIMGAIMGLYNMIVGVPENYFDSLTTLVFLLLLSRYFLQKIQEKGLSANDLHYFYQSESVIKVENNEEKEIHPRFIKVGDHLKIKAGEFIPVDGVILEGSSLMNNSLLTGESAPVKVLPNDLVFSGTQNLNEDLLILARKTQGETRLGKILKNVENGWANKSKMLDLMSVTSKYFTLGVIFLAAVLFIYLNQTSNFKHALETALTLLIVTCPCALALAVPLTFTRALSKASSQGMIIKSDEVLEKVSQIKNIFLDKTGTLTYGKLKIEHFNLLRNTFYSIHSILYSLEKKSKHPVAHALVEFALVHSPKVYDVIDYVETMGSGVSGRIGDFFYEIKREGVFENGELVATFSVKDLVRPEAKNILTRLKKNGFSLKILSGDRKQVVGEISKQIGLTPSCALSELSPEEKVEVIKSSSHSMMIGDGANDAIALSHSDVGVAVHGSMDLSLRAADVYLTVPDLRMVEKLIILSHETMKVIKRNLILSLSYNSLSVLFVFMGKINPLIAAVIMPVSSLTVLFSTLWGTKKMRNLWKS